MNAERMTRPSFGVRVMILLAAVCFCALSRNPLVHLEAWLGLSPAPWERFTGMKTVFSGMSEAFYRVATGDFQGAFQANFLAPPFALALICATLLWRWPRVRTRGGEFIFFTIIITASFAVNFVHRA